MASLGVSIAMKWHVSMVMRMDQDEKGNGNGNLRSEHGNV